MITCANCESEIEKDSFFCDQCGREVLLCVTCGSPGKGSFCENDGADLKPARLLAGAPKTTPPPVKEEKPAPAKVETAVQPAPLAVKADQPVIADQPAPVPAVPAIPVPVLRLVNSKLGIRLEIAQGAILGRTKGTYATQLGTLTSISGQHLSFRCDDQGTWSCQDLGSSNGTKYSRQNTDWGSLGRLAANTPVTLEDNTYLLVANVEFRVEIERPVDANTTVRL
jgi:hypothetical protein